MTLKDPLLERALAAVLTDLETEGEIVICTTAPQRIVNRRRDAVLDVAPDTGLNLAELQGLRSLAFHAIHDRGFFDGEKPTLTGYTAEGFQKIIDKLPTG